jgi:hypothetical protein
VKFEKSFDGHYPIAKIPVKWNEKKDEVNFDFEGNGFVLKGDASTWENKSNYVFNSELYIDGKLVSSPKLPVSFTTRSNELCWKYQLPKAKHTIRFKILNPSKEHEIRLGDAIIYSDRAVNGMSINEAAAKNNAK